MLNLQIQGYCTSSRSSFNIFLFILCIHDYKVGGQAVLGRQQWAPTPWLTERHGYDPTSCVCVHVSFQCAGWSRGDMIWISVSLVCASLTPVASLSKGPVTSYCYCYWLIITVTGYWLTIIDPGYCHWLLLLVTGYC